MAAAIKCGKCKQFHKSVGDVRKCSSNQLVEVVAIPIRHSYPATENQKGFINRLLKDRVWNGDTFDPDEITKDQASGIIGKLLNAPEKAKKETDIIVGTVSIPSQGKFTVVWPDDRRTYRFRTSPSHSNFKPGKVIVGYLAGPDNDSDYIEFGHGKTDQTIQIWNRFKSESLLADGLRFLLGSVEAQLKAGEMYAIESGNCWRCFRTLTVPASVARGLGPVCAGIVGV